jgi:4-hydroxybenzoate polyprenyltransferase/phosphoserine phosphatase
MPDVAIELNKPASTLAGPRPVEPPLCIDLDGTLIATDSLAEALLLLARQHPLDLLRLPAWLLHGKARLKDEIAHRVTVDVTLLPYRQEVLEFLRAEKANGRRIVLATASDHTTAEQVAGHLGLFDEIVGSRDGTNFKGPAKLAELERRFGPGNFDYMGDSTADLCIWKSSRRAYVVSGGAVLRKAQRICTPYKVFPTGGKLKPCLKALRPHQWVKNLLLFIPLILGHRLTDLHRISYAIFAFWSFSLCASAIYIINDLLDLESDRRHPTKRRRPFASGKLSAAAGAVLSTLLLLAAFALTVAVPWRFAVMLGVYLVLTTAYSFWLKRKLLVDVILLSGLYTHRIIAGSVAVDVELTMWLLAFSMFFFLSLAFAKRYSELIQVEDAGEEHVTGRGYQVRDLRVIESIGPSSGYLAVLVFCNYLDSPKVRELYPHPHVLWLVAPVLLYWITRIWFIARRRMLHDDPIIFAIRDRRSHVCGILVAVLVVIASWKFHLHGLF